MKITCLGCGNAFSKKSFNQTFLLEENGKPLPKKMVLKDLSV